MNTPEFVLELFLQPSEYYWGDAATRIRTILGSCVAITFWHPRLLLGAMCHYLLPTRPSTSASQDGSYADEVIPLIAGQFDRLGLAPAEFQVKMFGGSDMFPDLTLDEILTIGTKNIYMGERLLDEHGFAIARSDLAGTAQRRVIFEVWSGDVWVRQGARGFDGSEPSMPEGYLPRRRP